MFILGMLTGAGILAFGVLLGAAISLGSQPQKKDLDGFDVDIPS